MGRSPRRPVKKCHKKIAVECSWVYFMLLAHPPSPNFLDPLSVVISPSTKRAKGINGYLKRTHMPHALTTLHIQQYAD